MKPETTRDLILWCTILAGPVVWLCSFEANFAWAPWACTFQSKLALYVVTLLTLGIEALSTVLAWRQWRSLGALLVNDGAGALPRARIMAVSGIVLSAGFFIVNVAQAIPEVVLGACE